MSVWGPYLVDVLFKLFRSILHGSFEGATSGCWVLTRTCCQHFRQLSSFGTSTERGTFPWSCHKICSPFCSTLHDASEKHIGSNLTRTRTIAWNHWTYLNNTVTIFTSGLFTTYIATTISVAMYQVVFLTVNRRRVSIGSSVTTISLWSLDHLLPGFQRTLG